MTKVLWWGTVSNLKEILGTMRQFGDRSTTYIEITDMGLCYIDYAEETVEIHHDGYPDGYPLTSLGKDAFPTLMVVTGS